MGRGHRVRDAVGRGGAAHGDADVPGLGAVVYLGKNVRMNVDHDSRKHRLAPGVAVTSI